jgi:AraC-like DNA-binding protein
MSEAYKARYCYYRGRDNFSETFQSVLQRMNAAKLTGDSVLIMDAIYNVGRFLFMNGSYYESWDYFLQLQDMEMTTNNRVAWYFSLAQIYSKIHTGNTELISHYYDLAEAEMQKPDFSNPPIKSFILFGRAGIYLLDTDSDLFGFHPLQPSAIDSLQTAIGLLEESLSIMPLLTTYLGLAISHAQLGQFRQAHQYEEKAFEMTTTNPENLGSCNYGRSVVRYREKKFDEAIAIATEGLESSLSKHDLMNAQNNMNVLYHTYKTTGDMGKALYFHEQLTALNDSVLKKEKQEQMIMNQIKYDTQIKEEQLREAAERHKENVFRIRVFGTVAIVFIILSIFLFRLYSLKERAYKDLIRKNRQWASQNELEVAIKPNTTDNTDTEDEAEDEKDSATEPQNFIIVNQVHQMLIDGLFKKYELDIDYLADQAEVHPTTLSNAINRVTGKNFSQFINEYRIKETLRIMLDEKDFRFKEIYWKVGFNSYTTFYRTFKTITGLHPSQFKSDGVELVN